jgi:histidine triad (HIT) family protein
MGTTATRHCIFCEIVHGAGEASICYEDADAIAFMDIQPVNPGHVLIVPREHYESLNDVPEKVAMHLFQVALRLGPTVRRLTGCTDLNVVVNSGEAAGQNVFHYHVHLIPRRVHDGFDVPLPFHGSTMPDRTLLDAMAVRIICEQRDPVRRTSRELTAVPA